MLLLVKTSKRMVVMIIMRMAKKMRMSMQDDGCDDGYFDDDVE